MTSKNKAITPQMTHCAVPDVAITAVPWSPMSASTLAASGPPTLRIRGTAYPVLLPSVSDPRLHLAAVIISLQILGQTAFGFELSIAQILISLLTSAVLEFAIAFRRQRVIMWPASALLTGNGVAFVLRVPGTEHGDWWSVHGWWVFAGTAAIALLSKHLIRFRGNHVFNPSNVGLVLCFVILGASRADPLALWWGPMSVWLALALAIILVGGLVILSRIDLLGIAVCFWLTFAAGIAVVAASGHEMTARWHLGPITGFEFWRVLVLSPEVLVFLFFMITDPRTTPAGRVGRRVFAVAVALLAVLLIAPTTTEFWTKVALLAGLTLVCAARPALELLAPRLRPRLTTPRRRVVGGLAVASAAVFAALLVLAGLPARPGAASASPAATASEGLPPVTVLRSKGVATQIGPVLARQIARDLVADFRIEAEALRRRDKDRAEAAATGARLQALWNRIDGADNRAIVVPQRRIERLQVNLEAAAGQGPPLVVATVSGRERLLTVEGAPAVVAFRGNETPFTRTLELRLDGDRYLIADSRGGTPDAAAPSTSAPTLAASSSMSAVRLQDVADDVGVDFRQGAFRFEVTNDPVAMMGGGVCWLDVENDGWLDLFAVNSYAELDVGRYEKRGGLPRSALFRNTNGRFTDVSRSSGADVELRGNGCVAGDLNGDGFTDLVVTAAGYDALLWNDGNGRFTEGARAAGLTAYGWHAGATVGDINGDGRADLFVAGYSDLNAPIPGAETGFPNTYQGIRDVLYLNLGNDRNGHARFREVGEQLGIDPGRPEHGLGAVFTDTNGDGRLDLYVANDANPNRLYENVGWPGGAAADPRGLGFRLKERATRDGVADPNAGMGIAAGDYSGDGRPDLLVTNSHKQLHAVFRSMPPATGEAAFIDARSDIAAAFDTSLAGWGAAWVDLDLDSNLDLVLANGAIPVNALVRDAEPVQAFENLTGHGRPGQFVGATEAVDLDEAPRVVGRGLAAADFDNDGDLDLAVSSIGGRLLLLRASGARGNWLEVRLPRFVAGTVVTVVLPDGRRLVQELHAGSSYLSSEDPRAHFGLGKAASVREVIVRSPGGRETRVRDVARNQILTAPASG